MKYRTGINFSALLTTLCENFFCSEVINNAAHSRDRVLGHSRND
jgi:hypothetical protein